MYNPYSLEGKTILVTGASSGIGRALAIECSKLGASVILTARCEEKLDTTLSLMSKGNHLVIACDLSDSEKLDILVSQLPDIDGFASNAGFVKISPLKFIKEDDFKQILQVNTVSPILLIQKLLKKKKLKRGSSVVFTSAVDAVGATTPANSMYVASKGALSSFVRNSALELAPQKIRINAVCPGMVNTNILGNSPVDSENVEEDLKNYPLGRYGEPEDIAWAIIYLLSDASSWVTGTNLIIDGGLTTR